ncbi:MAG: serine protease [Candidatus Eremiobacteraeota bacterium]|nr:serine protease [Candidatus Eremiobacteraeota bacterium]
MNISDINFTTTRIEAIESGKHLATATGFFFKIDSVEYLVTNRHVVIDENQGYHPEHFRILLHANRQDLTNNNAITLSLYDDQKNPLWLEHPAYSKLLCDVVAIPMTRRALSGKNYEAFINSSIITFSERLTEIPDINPFGDVVVVGYPLGFSDHFHNLPVYRKAMIASQYGVGFRDKPYFLVDANLHPGTSGSPVVNSHHTLLKEIGSKEAYKLFGMHSAQHLVDEEPLGLNVVWYSYLIPEIIKR